MFFSKEGIQEVWVVRVDDAERLFVESLPLIERLSRFFCRESRMTAQDVEDFTANVRLHLIEDDYAVLRRFEGRCSLQTFLSLVIQHLLFDYRAQQWGRFRSSAHAQRLGPVAVRLETLLRRDGMPLDEALTVLRNEGTPMERTEAERLADAFPERRRRAVDVDLEAASDVAAEVETAEEGVAATERRAASEQLTRAMREAMAALSADDRTILRLHHSAGLSVADIARSMGLVQRQLYRRIPRIYAALRERLLAAGVDASALAGILGRPDTNLEFGLHEVEKPRTGSSTDKEGQAT